MVAVVYRIRTKSGTEWILKICSRAHDLFREVYFLTHFADRLPVPRIIDIVPPEDHLDGAILMECLPGNPLKMANLNDSLAQEMGSLLARIHLNRTIGYGDLTQPENLSSDPSLHFSTKFQEGLEECRGHLPQRLIDQCLLYYEQNRVYFTSLDGPCMIHRDFRAGNVIADNNTIQGVIDWSSARLGFAEEDFCPLEHGEWTCSTSVKKAFLSGYSSIRPVPHYTSIMPLLRLSKAIAVIGFTVKRGLWNHRHARLYALNRQFLDLLLFQTGEI